MALTPTEGVTAACATAVVTAIPDVSAWTMVFQRKMVFMTAMLP